MKLVFPPGPKPQPLIGNLLSFRKDPLDFFTTCAREYGDISYYRIANVNAYLLNHPDFIEYVLVKNNSNFIKGRVLRANRLLFGNGLLISEGDFWRRQRRLAQPAFHRDRISAYATSMTAYTGQMIATWKDGEIRDIYQDMKRLTLEIIAKILFGADIAKESEEVGTALRITREEFTVRIRTGLLIPESVPTPGNLRFWRAVRGLNVIVLGIIEQRRLSKVETGDCLSMLLAAQDSDGSQMTNEQLRDEVMTLFIAGHETTAAALTWAWYLLAKNPAVANRLRAELDQVLGARFPEFSDIPQLHYTEMVIKEVLRLYPPIWSIPRQTLHDCEIGGYRVPAGTSLTMSQWVMHRDPRYFDDPDKFKPERWENNLDKKLPPFVYFPFGSGPRQCIGNSLALTEITLILAMIAREFEFTLSPNHLITPWPSITLYPRDGIKVIVNYRNQHY
jgi:cytochrome P450